MVGFASASISLSKNAGDNQITLDGVGNTAEPMTVFMVFAIGAGDPVLNYIGTGSALTDMIAAGWGPAFEGMLGLGAGDVKKAWQVELKDTTDPFALLNGTLVTCSVTAPGHVFLLDQGGATLQDLYVPEPVTMLLLGLGGLFLRRK